MYLIKDIEIAITPDDVARVAKEPEIDLRKVDVMEPLVFSSEIVKGKGFVNNDGETIVLGATEKVQKILGLPFECFENMSRTIDNLKQECGFLQLRYRSTHIQLDNVMNAGFWRRLKWLFTGIKPHEVNKK